MSRPSSSRATPSAVPLADPPRPRLTQAEVDVLQQYAHGTADIPAIARVRGTSTSAVHAHIRLARLKLNASTPEQAVDAALSLGIIEPLAPPAQALPQGEASARQAAGQLGETDSAPAEIGTTSSLVNHRT